MAINRLYIVLGGVAAAVIVAALVVRFATDNPNASDANSGQFTLGVVGKAIPSAFVQQLAENNSQYVVNPVILNGSGMSSSPFLNKVILDARSHLRNSTFSTATMTYPATAADLDSMTSAVGGPSHFASVTDQTQDNLDTSGNVIGQVRLQTSEVNVIYNDTHYAVLVHKISLLSGRLH